MIVRSFRSGCIDSSRALGGSTATLEPIGTRDMSFEGQVLLPGREIPTRLYATYFCRRCGQEHHPVTLAIDGGSRTFLARSIDDAPATEQLEGADGRKEEQGFLTPVTGEDIAKFQGKPEEYPDEWLRIRRRRTAVRGSPAQPVRRCRTVAPVDFGHEVRLTACRQVGRAWRPGPLTILPGNQCENLGAVLSEVLAGLWHRETPRTDEP